MDGCVIKSLEAIGSCDDPQECRIGVCNPMAECEPTDEYGKAGQQTVEQIERADRPDTDEEEERSFDA
jgi:hypothetical protein